MKCRTAKYQKSFLPNVVNLWNNLERDLTTATSLDSFKTKLTSQIPSVPTELYEIGTRKLSIVHAQLRMHCSNLKSHLYELHVIDQPTCICGYRKEDARHYLLFCPL